MNILLLTSCNRIKQVLLSLSINAQIIKKPFNVVIVDSSTPNINVDEICELHQREDPYNLVTPFSFCSDVNLLYNAYKFFPQIEEFKVIHYSPRLIKQRGDSTSMALGIMQSSIMGNRLEGKNQNYCLKLTGTSILRYDLLNDIPNLLDNYDAVTWHRANIGGYERSTRVFGCRPDILSYVIAKNGWYDYIDDNNGIFEQRFARILEKELPKRINYTGKDETGVLLEGGMALQQKDGRKIIENFIKENNINVLSTPYLEEFAKGGIW